MAASPRRVRIGLVGCGNIARLFHLPQYPRIPEAQLVGLYDAVPERAASARQVLLSLLDSEAQKAEQRGDLDTVARCQADREGITLFESLEALIDACDAIDVTTPPRWHTEHAAQALERGRCVMVEKPMARTWWEAAQLAPTVAASQGTYQHNENWIYSPVVQTVRWLIESGAIGRVERVQWFQAHTGPDAFTPFWFCDPLASGGGSLTDWGVHSVCSAWYLAGFDKRPQKVRSDGIGVQARQRILGGRLRRLQVEDDALIEITLSDPATDADTLLLVEGTWSRFAPSARPTMIRVEGTRGEIEVEGSGFGTEDTVHVHTRFQGERSQRVACSRGHSLLDEAFLHEMRNLAVCVAEGQPPLVDYDVGLTTMAMLGAGYLSEINARQAVTLPDFEAYCRGFEARYPHGEVADEIIRALMAPYQ